jgi:NAD(P)H-dependent FMN reductase
MPESCRVMLVSGSLRQLSTNTAVLRTLRVVAPDVVEPTLYDGLGQLPHFNPDDDGSTLRLVARLTPTHSCVRCSIMPPPRSSRLRASISR